MFIQVHRLITKCLIATFLLGACGSVLFFSPSITHAENSTQSQIEELIKSLLVQIAALQAQLGQGQILEGGDKGESFSIGDQVQTTNTLNLRASAGTGGLLIKTLPANTKGTIVGGPESKNGYLWWKVSYNGVMGWSAHNWLSATGKYTIPKDITTLPPRDESLSVRIVTPISGSYEYGEKITFSWEQTGSAPSGSKACVTMRNVEKKKHFAFPSTGGCIDVVGDEPINTLTGEIVRTSGHDLPPGKYKFFVTIKGPSSADGKDGAQLATARDVGTFIIKEEDDEPDTPVSDDKFSALIAGVYEGSYPDGVRHSYGNHPQGSVDVYVAESVSREEDIILVLSSYEPVKWNVEGPGAKYIDKVFVTGYYNQEVVGLSPAVPIDSKTHEGGSSKYFISYDWDTNDLYEYLDEKHNAIPVYSSFGYSLEAVNIDLDKG